jgi:cation diffusion facilitator CzcD-associated flavoprotein CzcO
VDNEVVIIGAGPAGLAAAAEIRRAGGDPLVLERAATVASAWRGRHDHLRLNTHRMLSHQPGAPMPKSYGAFPARDDYVSYLEHCATEMRIQFGVNVSRIDPAAAGWILDLGGQAVSARHVVVATGPDAEPVMPRWPGMDGFPQPVIHAGQFRNVADMADKSVLVVGPGNSGTDLMNHLAPSKASALWLSARSGMNITPLRFAGIPMHPVSVASRRLPLRVQDASLRVLQRLIFGDLSGLGYPPAPVGAFSRAAADGVAVAVDDGFVAALKSGRVAMKPAIVRLDGPRVIFADGTSCAPDVIICATGYRPGLEAIAGHLVTLDRLGMPPLPGASGPAPARPGLWFFGLDRSIYGNMYIRRRQARQLARLTVRPARDRDVRRTGVSNDRPAS